VTAPSKPLAERIRDVAETFRAGVRVHRWDQSAEAYVELRTIASELEEKAAIVHVIASNYGNDPYDGVNLATMANSLAKRKD